MTPNPEHQSNRIAGHVYIPSNVEHGPACGERVACPVHGQPYGPHYLPAELHHRVSSTYVIAHDCGRSWRVA